ncbi:MAG TPA: long-chain fatty acid--CoA ligase [Actinomycetota bacterium]|nr:long-chain fatty acid--CoA ligase [Actinomycetota bacterium]
MMEQPLTLRLVLDRARTLFPDRGATTKTPRGLVRTTYREIGERCERLANALTALGVGAGDRVGSFAWNSTRHLELYLGVPCMGAVLHTLNIRLHPEQVAWIANHAEDTVIFVDESLLPVFEQIAPHLTTVKHIVIMADGDLPPTAIDGALSYEDLLANADPTFAWPDLDESSACAMAYTSGTTGNPKGVVYSHRSMTLHAFMSCMVDTNGIGEADVCLPIVPMFHANAWGIPWASALSGANIVFPAQYMTPVDILELIQSERVTFTAGVPTIWLGALPEIQKGTYDLSSIDRLVIGGAAVPLSLIKAYDELGIRVLQGWGMTETGPLASLSRPLSTMDAAMSLEELQKVRAKQGLPVAGVELRIMGDDGVAPWDGSTFGEVQVRGNWVARTYYNDERAPESWTQDGWLRTGDVAVVDPTGFVQLVDRTKDLVKSGGEWISSVDLENAIMGHPKVAEAAVIAIPDDKWSERPMACVVVKPGEDLTAGELMQHLSDTVPKWWLPEKVAFIDEVPKTSVGKFDKKVLRARYAEGTLS